MTQIADVSFSLAKTIEESYYSLPPVEIEGSIGYVSSNFEDGTFSPGISWSHWADLYGVIKLVSSPTYMKKKAVYFERALNEGHSRATKRQKTFEGEKQKIPLLQRQAMSIGLEFEPPNEANTNRWTLKSHQKLWEVLPPTHYAQLFYKNSVRVKHDGKSKPMYVIKKRMSRHDMISDRFVIRINSKSEKVCEAPPAKDRNCVSCRLIERWSFVYKKKWRYDFSKVATGKTKEEAAKSRVRYEIEIELLSEKEKKSKPDFHLLALSLIQKLFDLVATTTTDKKENRKRKLKIERKEAELKSWKKTDFVSTGVAF